MFSFFKSKRPDARKKPKPIGDQDKKENRGNKGEIGFGFMAIMENGIDEIQ